MCSSSSENCSDSEDEDSWDDYVDPPTQTNHEGGGSIISDLAKREPNKQKGVNVEKKPPKPKKERIQRSGWVNLNLTKNYGLASGWGLREGIRELMQNFADNVHGHPDGSERLVDWILESTENDTVLTYIAYNRGLTPKPRAGLHQRKNCLGYIVHRKKEGRFVLVNKKTALFRHIWSMGETSKGDREHHIGGHGEGMKVGIVALLRQGFEVTYYTNKEIWNWEFKLWRLGGDAPSRRLLSVGLDHTKPTLAKKELHIVEDIREARATASKDTTVIVQAPLGASLDIDFSDYLFLNPPKQDVMRTHIGDVLISDHYRGKIFVKGIFTQERDIDDPPPLRYGTDLKKAKLDRDRKSLLTGSQTTMALSRIWDMLIARPEGNAAKLYLKLLLASEPSLEILNAQECISRVSAVALYEELRSSFPRRFFYSLEDKEPSETIRIIRDCLHQQPEPIPVRLHNILLKYELITTPQAERLKIFANSPRAEPQLDDPWIRHTIHAFKSSLFLHPILKQSTFEFRDVLETVSIDILRDKGSESNGARFHIHQRFLNFDSVHESHASCPLFERLEARGVIGFHVVCDCAVEDLMELILSEVDSLAISEKKRIRSQHKRLLEKMPRHLSSTSEETLQGKIQTKIAWEVFVSGHFAPPFEVSFFPQIYGNIAREGHYFHENSFVDPDRTSETLPAHNNEEDVAIMLIRGGDERTVSVVSSNSSATNERVDSRPMSPSKSTVNLSSSEGLSDCLWQQKSPGGSCCFQWDLSNSPLVAGRKYVALVRAIAAKGSFFSEPLALEISCPAPQNVKVIRDGCQISVTWEFPSDVEAQFHLNCSSIYDQIYSSDLGNERKHDFEIRLEDVLLDLDIRVQAISSDQIKSTEVEVQCRVNKGRNHSISVPPQSADEETAQEPSNKCSDNEHCFTTSPSIQSSSHEYGDESDSSNKLPVSGSTSLNRPRKRVSKSNRAPITIDDAGSDVEGTEDDDPGSSYLSDSGEGFRSPSCSQASNWEPHSSPNIPELHPDIPLQTAKCPRDFGQEFEPGASYQIMMQPEDRTADHDSGHRVIHIHAIVTRTPELVLSVSTYILGQNLPISHNRRNGDDELFLIYSDWMNAGREYDAEDLAISKLKDVIGRCHLQMPIEVPEGPYFSTPTPEPTNTGTESYKKFVVQWGISAASLKMEMMPNNMLRMRALEMRNLNNPRNKVAINSLDALSLQKPFIAYNLSCGMGGLSTGFTEAGFEVAVGVETDPVAAESWKNNQSGRIFTENITDSMDKILTCIQKEEIAKPAVLLISAPEIEKLPLLSDSGDEGSLISWLAKSVNAIEILKPPLIVFETTPALSHLAHIVHLRPIIGKLLELGYEIHMSVLEATHFGVFHSQERLVLLASTVGLPAQASENLSRANAESDDIELKLRTHGFKLPFHVCGNHQSRLAQIERAFPPPMAKVIGTSLRKHVQTVMQMVASASHESKGGDRLKRAAEEELQSDLRKRHYRSETSPVF